MTPIIWNSQEELMKWYSEMVKKLADIREAREKYNKKILETIDLWYSSWEVESKLVA